MKILKRTGLVIGIFMAIFLLAYLVIFIRVNARINKKYDVTIESIEISFDSASLAAGKRLVDIRACRECHGADLGGQILVDNFLIGRFVVRNLTRGEGGLPPGFDAKDWVLAIKHGIRRDGLPLKLMPSHELSEMSEKDIADIIAYCSRIPDVDRAMPSFRIGPLAYVLTEFNKIPLLPAENTDHSKPFAQAVKSEVTVEYGKYLAMMCVNCHGENYKGSKSPVPGGKDRPDITSSGNIGKWTPEQFISTLRTGETPEGKKMNPADMPWTITKNYNDIELQAIHLFLNSLR